MLFRSGDLNVHKVVKWIKRVVDSEENTDKACVTSLPTVQPEGGEVYSFKLKSVVHESKFL